MASASAGSAMAGMSGRPSSGTEGSAGRPRGPSACVHAHAGTCHFPRLPPPENLLILHWNNHMVVPYPPRSMSALLTVINIAIAFLDASATPFSSLMSHWASIILAALCAGCADTNSGATTAFDPHNILLGYRQSARPQWYHASFRHTRRTCALPRSTCVLCQSVGATSEGAGAGAASSESLRAWPAGLGSPLGSIAASARGRACMAQTPVTHTPTFEDVSLAGIASGDA